MTPPLLLEAAALLDETVLGDLQTALTVPPPEPLELLPEDDELPEPPELQAARVRTAVALNAAMDRVDVRMPSHLSRVETAPHPGVRPRAFRAATYALYLTR